MQRVTLTIDDDLLAAIDAHGARRGYATRSEAVRDVLRGALGAADQPLTEGHCHATLSYVYDHEKRELSRRLTQVQHGHHDLGVASLHVHLDHDTCLEVAVLSGPVDEVRALADAVVTQRGVRYGYLHLLPAEAPQQVPDLHAHGHTHGHANPHSDTVSHGQSGRFGRDGHKNGRPDGQPEPTKEK